MAKFSFRLQKVLKVREATRRQRRADLAEALHAERILTGQAQQLLREKDGLRRSTQQAAGTGEIDVARLLSMQRYEFVLKNQLRELGLRQQQLQTEIERRRDRLLEADREVRVLEKLRDRQETQFMEDEQRRETLQMDEVAQLQQQRMQR